MMRALLQAASTGLAAHVEAARSAWYHGFRLEDTSVDHGTPEKSRIFQLLRIYHQSRENIRLLLDLSGMTDYEKVGFIDAWQEEMADFFARHGYCFACNRLLERCGCEDPIRPPVPPPAA